MSKSVNLKWGVPSRWSFHPISALGSIVATTIRKMRFSLAIHDCELNLIQNF